jgi:hypothetical protein
MVSEMSSERRSDLPSAESVGFAKLTLVDTLVAARDGTLKELVLAMRAANKNNRIMVNHLLCYCCFKIGCEMACIKNACVAQRQCH